MPPAVDKSETRDAYRWRNAEEGLAYWNRQKEASHLNKLQEQREVCKHLNLFL